MGGVIFLTKVASFDPFEIIILLAGSRVSLIRDRRAAKVFVYFVLVWDLALIVGEGGSFDLSDLHCAVRVWTSLVLCR